MQYKAMWVRKTQLELNIERTKAKRIGGLKSVAMWSIGWILIFVFGYNFKTLSYNLVEIEDLLFALSAYGVGLVVFYIIGYRFDWVRTDYRKMAVCNRCEETFSNLENLPQKCACKGEIRNIADLKWIENPAGKSGQTKLSNCK